MLERIGSYHTSTEKKVLQTPAARHTSEVAAIREQIAREYEASKQVFDGFTATAAHAFITARQENIEACYTELIQYMSPPEAIQFMVEVENSLQPSVSGNTS